MTHPQLTPLNEGGGDYLDIRARQGQLMLVRVWDVAEEVITANNPDGWVYPRDKTKEPFPNSVVRAAIVDLGVNGADGLPGKVYPEAWIQASSIMKEAKKWKGQLKLVVWKQKDPTDKSSLYDIFDMTGDQAAVALFQNYVERHPEFYDLTPPEPYEPRRREQRQPPGAQPQTQQQPWAQQQPYQGQQQPGYYGQQPPQQQWQPPIPPAQPPSQWNTAAPPPEYYTQQPQWAQQQHPQHGVPQVQQYPTVQPPQQYQAPAVSGTWGSPPQQDPGYGWQGQGQQMQQPPQQQAPQGQPGSFFRASQGQQGPQAPRPVNHQGWPQNEEPPF